MGKHITFGRQGTSARWFNGFEKVALAAGILAAAGALAILLANPIQTGNWQLKHVLTPLLLAITITITTGKRRDFKGIRFEATSNINTYGHYCPGRILRTMAK